MNGIEKIKYRFDSQLKSLNSDICVNRHSYIHPNIIENIDGEGEWIWNRDLCMDIFLAKLVYGGKVPCKLFY